MVELYPEKMVTIITTSMLEEKLVKVFRKRGTSGYTVVRARGGGSRGVQSGLDYDTNIQVEVVVPPDRIDPLLEDLKRLIDKGHHLTVMVSDVQVISPEKFTRPFDDGED